MGVGQFSHAHWEIGLSQCYLRHNGAVGLGVAPDEAVQYVMTTVIGTNCFTGAHGDVRWLKQHFVSLFVVCLRMARGGSFRLV